MASEATQAVESGPGIENEPSETDVIGLLEEIENGRTRVQRVREHLIGEREASSVKPEDWFAVLEYARDDADVDLVLYFENDHPEAPSTATVYAIDEKYGRAKFVHVCEVFGFTPETIGNRDEICEDIRHTSPDLLPVDEAKDRFHAFARRLQEDE